MSTHNLNGELILREVFSLTDGALKTVPSSNTSFAIELDATDGDSIETRPMAVDLTTIQSALSAASNQTSSGIDILKYKGYCVLVSWAAVDATDGTMKLQASIDNSTFEDISGATVTMSSAAGSKLFNISDAFYKYFRVVYTKNANTTGTVTSKYVAKG